MLGYLSTDLIGADGVLVWSFAVAEIVAQKYERERDEEPETQHAQHGSQWYDFAAVFGPNENIEDNATRRNDCGVKHSSLSIGNRELGNLM